MKFQAKTIRVWVSNSRVIVSKGMKSRGGSVQLCLPLGESGNEAGAAGVFCKRPLWYKRRRLEIGKRTK